jgi:hypothetical protein
VDVTDPSGNAWHVDRRLIELPRWHGFGDGDEGPSGDVADAVAAGPVGVMEFVFVVVLPTMLEFVAELAFAGFRRVGLRLLGRWTVIAESHAERRLWHVRGRRESERFATELVERLRIGSALPAAQLVEWKTVSGAWASD